MTDWHGVITLHHPDGTVEVMTPAEFADWEAKFDLNYSGFFLNHDGRGHYYVCPE